jgi:short subunit dehydrogenase-like uncharacterized protein
MQPLVYGAYGFTGELVAREAVAAGLDPVLAGRRREPLERLGAELDLPTRVFDLGDAATNLDDIDAVAHCAGPFVDTHGPMVEACIETGTHYLDITGEVAVFESVREDDERAREAGVMLLPGSGFDVVPSDCLAKRLHERLPGASRLTLALVGSPSVSPGTARTVVRGLGEGSLIRRAGELRSVPLGGRTREIDTRTGRGPQLMSAIPWGDVSTAYHSTGIPDIDVYVPTSERAARVQRVLGRLGPVLGFGPVRRALEAVADRVADGPDERERAEGSAFLWGEVGDGEHTVEGRVHVKETYQFTAEAVVAGLERVADGDHPAGFQTPATAYGSGFVLDVEGSRFEDIVTGEAESSSESRGRSGG